MDPNRSQLYNAVNDVLDQLIANPGQASVRRIRFQEVGLWCIPIYGSGEEWVLLWEPFREEEVEKEEREKEAVLIQYLGPASFI
ncbi:MAG: hypothetical protein JJLCMIEE_03078 [Acidimicrobiales bacterium]|nr:hypothetical protein [Acidimicrobiales bacterium]